MNTRSLRFCLIIWYAGLLTGIFVLCGGATYDILRHYLTATLAEALHRRADQVAALLVAGADKTGEKFVADQVNTRYAPANYDRYIRISHPDGRVIYASGRAASFDPAGLPVAATFKRSRVATLPAGDRLLLVSERYRTAGGHNYIIESGGPMQPIDTVLAHVLFMLLLGVPIMAAVAVAGGNILVGRALAPVVQIAHSAEQITLHNLDGQLPLAQTGDELEQLSLALNNMIGRLREAFDQNRRFLADASHELRTPLTALRGELESAVEEARPTPALCDKVGSALEEVDRLAKIVQTLFAISRLDAGEAQAEWLRFDLAQLASGTADQMSLLAEDKGVSVQCEAAQAAPVEGDRARVKQVVVNLLDNAIKYTPSGGAIRINVRSVNGKAVLEVVDTGIGIPASALPHVFDRFYRVDKARSRDAGGAGLGLAIVKSICAAHGGQVDVESAEGHGSRFTVALPLAPEK